MTDTQPRGWLLDRPLTGFALPRGRSGRLAGRLMGLVNKGEQREVFELLRLRPGEQILETGYGPGVLLGMALQAGATVAGVDPSPDMHAMASRRVGAAVRDGRADLRVGTAEDTGFPDASFGAVVSVNNMPMWSDLHVGLRELHRVLRPGGRVVIGWHGGSKPHAFVRNLVLPDDVLDRVLAGVREVFGSGERIDGRRTVAFRATRDG